MPHTPTANTLFYGDNVDILREHVADDSVDLIYLDPAVQLERQLQLAVQVTGDRHALVLGP